MVKNKKNIITTDFLDKIDCTCLLVSLHGVNTESVHVTGDVSRDLSC